MDANGILHVQLRDGEKDIGTPLTLNCLGVAYTVPLPAPGHTYGRSMIEVENIGEPLEQPSKVVIKGKLEDNVAFFRQYEFQGNQIQACGGFRDPPRITYASYGRLAFSIPQTFDISPKTEQPEREQILKGCVLKTKELIARRTKHFEYPYDDILHFSGQVEEAEIKGPWGPRSVKLTSRNFRNMAYGGWIYPDFCPWQGYYFAVALPTDDLKPAWRAVVTIE